MPTFHLLRTRSGKLLVTTETKMTPEEMDRVAAVLKLWSEGPETGVLLIPDCVFELEVVDDEITLVGPAVAREAMSHPPVAPERQSLVEQMYTRDARGLWVLVPDWAQTAVAPERQPLVEQMTELLDGARMKATEIALHVNADLPIVRQMLNRNPRFMRDERGYWSLVPNRVPTATP